MCVLLFDVFKHLLLRKTGVLKTCWKTEFFGKNILRNALAISEEQKGTRIFEKKFILALLSSAVFSLQNDISDFFKIVFFKR